MENFNSSFIKEKGLKMQIVDLDNGFFPNTDITGNIIILNNIIINIYSMKTNSKS